MTTVYEIPTAPKSEAFQISLNGVDYRIVQRFNVAMNAWVVDIISVDGTPKLRGLMLVTGVDLLSQFEHLGLGGQLQVQSDDDVDRVPDYATLGSTGHLYFLPN